METPQRSEVTPGLSGVTNLTQSVEPSSSNRAESQSPEGPEGSGQDHQVQGNLIQQRPAGDQSGYQDTNSSPALVLFSENDVTEFSFLQQSDGEFSALRPYPDISVASDRFTLPPPHRHMSQVSEGDSLSQHPLTEASILSEAGPGIGSSDPPLDDGSLTKKDLATRPPTLVRLSEESYEEETRFLRKEVSARQLMELLQREVGVPSSSSGCSAGSSSGTSLKNRVSEVNRGGTEGPVRRERPPGEASLPPQQKPQPDTSEIFNITCGSRSTQPDSSCEELHRELLAEAAGHRGGQNPGSSSGPGPAHTPHPSKTRVRPDLLSSGPERGQRGHDLWSSGNPTGMDGSYLGFLPRSQSTPGVLQAPPTSRVKATLPVVESDTESSYLSQRAVSPQPEAPAGPGSSKVQSLPSLTYQQKVDAWRANHSAGRTSLFESSAPGGFSGVSAQKKAVSEPGTWILGKQVRTLHTAMNQNRSAGPSGLSSPRRGEAVGSAPSEDHPGSAALSSTSPFATSRSHSSLSTVVMSARKDQGPDQDTVWGSGQDALRGLDQDALQSSGQNDLQVLGQDSDCPPPPARMSLSHFSDVSLDSLGSAVRFGASLGASSITSLEVDNYAPYWTSRPPPTPPPSGAQELNIEERIPLYLQKLGIDQSPSTILTPFVPRGPIREPEFSPTGTPIRSTQPSEGVSPQKTEFSRSSLLSMDSNMSAPFSLAPAVSRQTGVDLQSGPHRQGGTSDQSAGQSEDTFDSDLSAAVKTSELALEKSAENSVVSSKASSEFRKVLSQPDRLGSTGPTEADSSDSDLLLSLKTRILQDPVDLTAGSVPLWHRSSSDSSLTADHQRHGSVGPESRTLSWQPENLSTRSLTPTPAAASDPLLSKSARRAEPEGCSAAPPDSTVTRRPPVSPTQQEDVSVQPLTVSSEEDTAADAADDAAPGSLSPPLPEEVDPGAMSDVSSRSELALRAAMLLQKDCPSTPMSSSPSTIDQDRVRNKEWRKEQHLELDSEQRIEEFKRELQLRFPNMSQLSTDTESSALSSLPCDPSPRASAEIFSALSDGPRPQFGPLTSTRSTLSGPGVQDLDPRRSEDLEAQVLKIAAREGIIISRTALRTLTSRARPPTPTREPLKQNQSDPNWSLEQGQLRRDAVGGQTPPPGPNAQEEPLTRTTQVSQVRLTLSTQPTDHGPLHSGPAGPPQREFVPLRPSPVPTSSPDEGVGLSSPPDWPEIRESQRLRGLRGSDTSTMFRAVGAQRRFTSTTKAVLTPPPRPEGTNVPAAPVLVPYKPPGTEEFFYVPQLEPDVSSIGPSDTTMESTHPGSDDAVPPNFSVDVLGTKDPGLDRGVHFRHSEGVYSRRTHNRHTTDSSVTAEKNTQTPKTSFNQSLKQKQNPNLDLDKSLKQNLDLDQSLKQNPNLNQIINQNLDQSINQNLDQNQSVDQSFRPLPAEMDSNSTQVHPDHMAGVLPEDAGPVSLDQMWQWFCEHWSQEVCEPRTDREGALLQRLHSLSQLMESRRRGNRGGGLPAPPPAEGAPASSSSSQSLPLSTGSSRSSSRSDRVRTSALSKLYHSISQQRSGREQRRGQHQDQDQDQDHVSQPNTSRIPGSEVPADSESSLGSYEHPTGPSRTPVPKGAVRVVSRGIQTAGDLEIVSSGTRPNTRDVGTTFPSPLDSRASTYWSAGGGASSSSSRGGGVGSKRRGSHRPRKTKKSPAKPYPAGVSWFISAEDLRSEARKENHDQNRQEETRSRTRTNTSMFVPFTRTRPRREPLRQIHEERTQQNLHAPPPEPGPDLRNKTATSGSTLSLQEALRLRRPDFVLRSRQRQLLVSLAAEWRKVPNSCSFYRGSEVRVLLRPKAVRRAVPWKEMIQRSKQIYEKLPEVQRKREEQRRKEEYTSYRNNAQLYNKRITDRLLGRRTVWN